MENYKKNAFRSHTNSPTLISTTVTCPVGVFSGGLVNVWGEGSLGSNPRKEGTWVTWGRGG